MAQLRESRLTTVLHILQSHLGQAVLGLLTGEPAEQSPLVLLLHFFFTFKLL